MKPNLSKKLVILSLSAALLVGATGCERRGRAPVKADKTEDSKSAPKGATPGVVQSPQSPDTPKTAGSEKAKEAEVATSEMVESAQLNCKTPIEQIQIDALATPTEESFISDLEKLSSLRECLADNGLSYDQNGKLDEAKAQAEYDRLTNVKDMSDASNGETARKTLGARAHLGAHNLKNFSEKYGEGKLKGTDGKVKNAKTGSEIVIEEQLADAARLADDLLSSISTITNMRPSPELFEDQN